jgi:hypothetical protein
MFRQSLLGLTALLVCVTSQAQAEVKLAWQLKVGDQLVVELADTEKMMLAALGQEIKNESTTLATLKVEKVNPDGSIVLSQKIDSIKAKGGGPAAAFMDTILKEIEGSTVKVTLNDQYQFQKLEGADEIITKAGDKAQLPPQAAPLIKNLVMGTLLKPTERVFGFKLPDKAVNKGDKWSQKLSSPLGVLGKTTVVHNYTYEGGADGKEKIDIVPSISFSPEDNKDGGGLGGLTVKKADLKAEKAKGTVLFDNAAGKLAQNDMAMRLKGTITISAMNQDFPLDIDIDTDNKTKVTTKAP